MEKLASRVTVGKKKAKPESNTGWWMRHYFSPIPVPGR